MKRFPKFALLVAASALLLSPSFVMAQYERRQQPEVQREGLQCAGTVKQVGRGVIGVVTDAGDQWVFQLEARPQDLSFTGSADATFVKPGMWIRFTTHLTRRGDAKEPIDSAEIYTPREGYGVGVYREGVGETGGGEGGGALFAPAGEEKPKPKAKAEPKIRDEDVLYTVGGQVSKISRLGELTINAGGTSVKAKLTEDARISVSVADLTFLQPGDKIELQGWHPAGTKGQGVATQVTASAAQPLTDTSKKKKSVPTAEKPAAEGDIEPKSDKSAAGEKKDGDKPAAEKKDE